MRFTDDDITAEFEKLRDQYEEFMPEWASALTLVPGVDNPVSGRTSWHIAHEGQPVLTLGATRRLAFAALVHMNAAVSLIDN